MPIVPKVPNEKLFCGSCKKFICWVHEFDLNGSYFSCADCHEKGLDSNFASVKLETYWVYKDGKMYTVKTSGPIVTLRWLLPQIDEDGTRNIYMEEHDTQERVLVDHNIEVYLPRRPHFYVDLPARM